MGVWPLTGRDEERAFIRRQLMEDRRGVVLVAPPGTGKTRLLQTLAEELDDDVTIARIAGTQSARALPLGALAGLLPDDQSALLAPLDVFRAVRRRLTNPAVTRPHLLVVDDEHLLDALSSALVGGVRWPERRGGVIEPSMTQIAARADAIDGLAEIGVESAG